MIGKGSVVTYTDPLSGRSTDCVVTELVTSWFGTQRRGTAYNVIGNGRNWTAQLKNLEETK
jgi:hypothetical protein